MPEGVEEARRATRLPVRDLQWSWRQEREGEDCLELAFTLPTGAFATTVMAELMIHHRIRLHRNEVQMDIQLSGIGMTSARTRDRLVQRLRDAGIQDERILDAIRNTPRHLFIEEALAHQAYDDTALPIGHGQTISQPWVVARMTELLMAQRQAAQGSGNRHWLRLPDCGAGTVL